MKLSDLSIGLLNKAVGAYFAIAYGSGESGRKPDLSLPGDSPVEDVLGLFSKEVDEQEGGRSRVRYTMRLGNRNYPFMKLVLQEHLVAGEYCFGVDTHDEMDIRPEFPDYKAWMAVQRFNSDLKKEIETRLAADGVDTSATLRRIASDRRGVVSRSRGTVLVVDDEVDLAEAVEALLMAEGYRVTTAHEGAVALDLAAEWLPDLILLDYELPEMDGLEVIAALRSKERTRGIPVLLSTASRVSIEDIARADGFLAKPFQEDLLYEMVARLVGNRTDKEIR